jgi:glycerol-3-phosphate dehydrogenase (NAD(P)+)
MKTAVLGGGSWGITLAAHLSRGPHQVRLWEFNPERAARLHVEREDPIILPGITLPELVRVTSDMENAIEGAESVVYVVPSHTLRSTAQRAAAFWPKDALSIIAAKGLEENTLKRMDEVLEECLPKGSAIVVLSGPSHAEEVARFQPTALVAASRQASAAAKAQFLFHADPLRVYTSADVAGVGLGGSLKNVIALAAGILDGLGLGDNTKAALMTRGLHEITRLGTSLGASPQTFAGLTGMGDLFVTCMSRHSRNRLLGEKIGKGLTLEAALKEMVMVAEGVRTARAAFVLARRVGVEVPIIDQVNRVLFEDVPALECLKTLMARNAKPESLEP